MGKWFIIVIIATRVVFAWFLVSIRLWREIPLALQFFIEVPRENFKWPKLSFMDYQCCIVNFFWDFRWFFLYFFHKKIRASAKFKATFCLSHATACWSAYICKDCSLQNQKAHVLCSMHSHLSCSAVKHWILFKQWLFLKILNPFHVSKCLITQDWPHTVALRPVGWTKPVEAQSRPRTD